MPGMEQTGLLSHLSMFYIMILSQTILYGAIIRIAGKAVVSISILYHTMFNAIHSTILFPLTWTGTIVSSVMIVTIAIFAVVIHNQKFNQAKNGQ